MDVILLAVAHSAAEGGLVLWEAAHTHAAGDLPPCFAGAGGLHGSLQRTLRDLCYGWPQWPCFNGKRRRTGFAAGQHVHEGGLAGPRAADEGGQNARLEGAAAVAQQLQHGAPAHSGCLRASLLRRSRHLQRTRRMPVGRGLQCLPRQLNSTAKVSGEQQPLLS